MPGAVFVQKPVVRLVLPFDFAPNRLSDAVEAVERARWTDAEQRLWSLAKPRYSYVDELTRHAEAMLFGGRGNRHAGAHLRVDETLATRWFQGVVLQPERCPPISVKLVPQVGIELFATGHGSGALSVTLELSVDSVPALLDSVYRLAQRGRRRGDPSWIRIPHPADDPERLQKILAEQRAKLESERRPSDDAALEQRLGKRGGRFTVEELADALIAPLASLGVAVQEGSFLAFTVARFDASTRLDADAPPLVLPLIGLAQVEESTHAGGGIRSVETTLLNARHLAAVSPQGAAHFVADQEGVGFDEERQTRVRDKYFVPYLTSVLQRSALRRVGAATHSALTAGERRADGARALRFDLLELAASGMPAELSTRGAVQRYGETCRTALGVQDAYDRAERAIAGIEQVLTSKKLEDLLEAQRSTAEKSGKNLHAAHQLHASLAWLEIFIITAYTAEVLHILEGAYGGHDAGPAAHGLSHALVYVVAMMIAGGIAAWVLKPWRHHH
jgi:hypothetical protein